MKAVLVHCNQGKQTNTATVEFSADVTALEPTLEENLLLGQALLQSRQLEAALEEFESALTKAPELAHVHLVIGKIHSRKHDYQKAEEAFSNAARLDPLSAQPLLALAKLHLHRGALQEAAEEFQAALAIDTKSDMALVGLGRVALQRGDLDVAEHHLQKALEHVPDLIEAKMPLADVYRRTGRWQEAISLLEHVPAGSPQAPMVKLKQADLLLGCHRYREASEVLERLRADYPMIIGTPGPAQLSVISAFLATGQMTAAVEADATTIDFRDLAARQQRLKGVMEAQAGQDRQAITNFLNASQIEQKITGSEHCDSLTKQQEEMERQLRQAFGQLEMGLRYEPIVALASQEIAGWMLKLNWPDAIQAIFSQADISSVLDRCLWSRALGWWQMTSACRFLSNDCSSDQFVCLELGEQQLQDPALCEQLAFTSGAFALSPTCLILQVPSHILGDPEQQWNETHEHLRMLSVRIMGSPQQEAGESASMHSSVDANIVRMHREALLTGAESINRIQDTRDSDVKTLATGVETAEQASRLSELGIDYAAGPLYAVQQI